MYSIFEELLKKHNVTAYKVSKATGVTTATLTSWKQGVYTPKADKLQKIADYFMVPLDYLTGANPKIKEAIDKYGFCWPPEIAEDIKVNSRSTVYNENLPIEERVFAAENIFKSYFSKSLEVSQYDLRHPAFPDYVAMLLNQSRWKENWGEHLYNALVEKYGIGPNLIIGTYFYCSDLNRLTENSTNSKTPVTNANSNVSALTGIYFSLGAKARDKQLSEDQVKNIMKIIDSMESDKDKK